MLWNSLDIQEQLHLRNLQAVNEEQQLLDGVAAYWKDYERAPDEGIPEQRLLDIAIAQLRDSYQIWIDKLVASARTPRWVLPLLVIGPEKMADLTFRSVLSRIINKTRSAREDNAVLQGYVFYGGPILQHVALDLANHIIAIVDYQGAKHANREHWLRQSKYIKSWQPARCKAFSKKMQHITRLSAKEKRSLGHNLLLIAETSGIIEIVHSPREGSAWRKISWLRFRPEVFDILTLGHSILESVSSVFRPMIVPPIDHTLIMSGGNLQHWLRKPVVQRFMSTWWDERAQEQVYSEPSQECIDAVNVLQQTEWCVNKPVLEVMTNMFKSNNQLANLPAYDFDGFSFKDPYPEDGEPRDKAIWKQQKTEAWGAWYKEEQKRARMLVRLYLAEQLTAREFFYMVHTMDFRGRIYAICDLLSCQSSDFDRALIHFAQKEKQTTSGEYWLRVHLANLFEQDRLTFDERVQWTHDQEKMLRKISEDPYSNKEWISAKIKKNPSFQRLAAIYELFRTDGMTQLPIQMDGKCNGAQHWSAIMGDEKIAILTNVLPSEGPQDLYQFIADITTNVLKGDEMSNEFCAKFLEHWSEGIDRSVCKRPTMCDPYGLTFYGIQKYVKLEGHVDWYPEKERGAAVVELARAITSGLDQALEGPNRGKDFLRECALVAADLNEDLIYTTPSGFKVRHYYHQIKKRRSFAELFNKKLTFVVNTEDVDKKDALLGIAPNFIHSMDASHMVKVVNRLVRAGIESFSMIHDSFGVHAPFVSLMRDIITEEFYQLHKGDVLYEFRKEIKERLEEATGAQVTLPDLPKTEDIIISRVLESQYFVG